MWLVEEFADFYAQSLESAQKNIPRSQGAPTPPSPGSAPPAAPAPEEKIVVWDFRTHQVLIASFLGAGKEISVPGTDLRIGTWMFKVEPGKIYHVPQWPCMNVPDRNFLGFLNEIPGDGSMYMLQYGGLDEANKVLMKIFKK